MPVPQTSPNCAPFGCTAWKSPVAVIRSARFVSLGVGAAVLVLLAMVSCEQPLRNSDSGLVDAEPRDTDLILNFTIHAGVGIHEVDVSIATTDPFPTFFYTPYFIAGETQITVGANFPLNDGTLNGGKQLQLTQSGTTYVFKIEQKKILPTRGTFASSETWRFRVSNLASSPTFSFQCLDIMLLPLVPQPHL